MVPVQVFVMHFMCPLDGFDVAVIASGKPFESLMDHNVMDKKISDAVQQDTQSDVKHPVKSRLSTEEKQQNTWCGKD